MPAKKAQPKKRRAKEYFTGSRCEFLNSYRDEYISLRGKNRSKFWHKLFAEWWRTYPWRLADDEEPPTGDAEKMGSLSQVSNNDELELELKRGVEKRLQQATPSVQKITTWFSYQASVHNSRHEGGLWSQILKHIHEQANTKPRCRSVSQQFMFENPRVVDAAFVERYGQGVDLSQIQKMNHRNELAKSLVNTDYKHLAEDLMLRAKETHERELKEWGLGLQDIGEAADVQSARDSLFSAVHPLLNFIGRYSGCYVTLLASGASAQEDGNPYFSTVHYFPEDRSRRKNWTEYDQRAFKTGVAGPFVEYIRWMEGSEDKEPATTKERPLGAGRAASSIQPPSTNRPHQPVSAFQEPMNFANQEQGKKPKKRRFVSPAFTDEDDVGMIAEDNSNSSSVDPDELPTKRPRRSTVITRKPVASFRALTASTAVGQNNPSPGNGSISVGTAADPGLDVRSPPSPFLGSDVDSLAGFSLGSDVDSIAGFTFGSDIDSVPESMLTSGVEPIGSLTLDLSIPGGAPPLWRPQGSDTPPDEDAEPSPVSRDSPPNAGPIIPDFLTAKSNVYGYLVTGNEPGFMTLLDNYIAFELADRSGVRGSLPTTHRPTAVGWWTSRARPDKTPPLDSPKKKFRDWVVEWWISIQPDWRGALKCGETNRADGSWECLYQPGINGLLNVVIVVYWWSKSLEGRAKSGDAAYHWLVADITWVLSRLTCVASEGLSTD